MLVVATPASAEPRRKGARLTWVRGVDAERCVGKIALEEDVKGRLGYDPFALSTDTISIDGMIFRAASSTSPSSASGYRAELVMRDPTGLLGTRQLASREADCRSLGEAVAIAITVAIDPDAAGTRLPAIEVTPPSAPLLPEPKPAPAPPKPERQRENLKGHASLSVGGSGGVVPGFAVVTALRVRARLARWELGVGAHIWPESRDAGLGIAMSSGTLDACVAPLSQLARLRWCAGVHLGLLHVFVHSPELAPVEVGSFVWSAGETGPTLSVPLVGALHLDASAGLLLPILRTATSLRGQTAPLWEQSAVAARADVGVGLSF